MKKEVSKLKEHLEMLREKKRKPTRITHFHSVSSFLVKCIALQGWNSHTWKVNLPLEISSPFESDTDYHHHSNYQSHCQKRWYTKLDVTLFLRRGVVVNTTAQLYSSKPELRFCKGAYHARSVLEIFDGKDLWQRSWLEIRLNAFRWSTIPQKQFIMFKKLLRKTSLHERWK